MKKQLLILLLFPFLSFGQVQIGDDIDGDMFIKLGFSVSLSSDGSILAVSAPNSNGENGGNDVGSVRVYENQGNTWIQIGQDINGENEFDFFGRSISLSSDGTVIAVNAFGGNDVGSVRVYENQNNVWTQIGQDISGETPSQFRVSLSSEGNILAIGEPLNSESGQSSGQVKVYENQDNTWIQIGQNINGENASDNSGASVYLSSNGNIIAIGEPENSDNGISSGQVRVYENQNGVWTQIGEDINGEIDHDDFGLSVSLSSDGGIIAISLPNNDENGNNTGKVRVYENQGGVWTQIGEDINGEIDDSSGRSISLSSDGRIVAISAEGNSTNANPSGRVRIYRNQEGVWTQIGQNIDGEEFGDRSGNSVSLSSDGTTVAIGASANDDNGVNSGHVRVYDLSDLLSTEEVSQSQFSIYPNPASTNVTIQLDQNSVLEKTTIYNSLGQIVKTSIETTINTSNLSKGIYILEVTTNEGMASKKLIID